MGKKRKHEKSKEEIRRKIKKLQAKLNSAVPEEHNSNSSPQHLLNTTCEGSPYSEYPLLSDNDEPLAPYPASPQTGSPCPAASPKEPSPAPGTSTDVVQPEPAKEQDLDEDILRLLGDAPKTDTPMGPPVHKDVARRWQDIIVKGLPKEVKEDLMKAYPVPSNCTLLLAPGLNPEVKAALHDGNVKRDASIMSKQKQLGVALSALASATDLILSSDMTIKHKLLKPISDACRILCDSHFLDTKLRRYYALTSINSKLKDTLQETQRDSLLFGENITEKVKTAKTIQQSGDALKHIQRPKVIRSRVTANPGPSKGRVNFTPQHRKTDNKPPNQRRMPRPAQRPPPPPPSSSTRRNSPPPRTTTYRK